MKNTINMTVAMIRSPNGINGPNIVRIFISRLLYMSLRLSVSALLNSDIDQSRVSKTTQHHEKRAALSCCIPPTSQNDQFPPLQEPAAQASTVNVRNRNIPLETLLSAKISSTNNVRFHDSIQQTSYHLNAIYRVWWDSSWICPLICIRMHRAVFTGCHLPLQIIFSDSLRYNSTRDHEKLRGLVLTEIYENIKQILWKEFQHLSTFFFQHTLSSRNTYSLHSPL